MIAMKDIISHIKRKEQNALNAKKIAWNVLDLLLSVIAINVKKDIRL